MAEERPTISTDALATILEEAPSRLRKKLERQPDAASGWTWTRKDHGVEVVCEQETVTFAAEVTSLEDISCTCLLSPRCFHILACVQLLEAVVPDEASDREASNREASNREPSNREPSNRATGKEAEVAAETLPARTTTAEQRQVANECFRALAQVLVRGALNVGLVTEATLLRNLRQARRHELYRLGGIMLSLVELFRELRLGKETFRRRELTDQLHAGLECAHRLAKSTDDCDMSQWLGIARRHYEPVQGLRLHALLTRPILTRTGWAGVVTIFYDQHGQAWSLSQVQQGNARLLARAYRGSLAFGDAALSHQQVSRAGLFVQKATGSMDGRLGGGTEVIATRAKASTWEDGALAARWEEDFETQRARYLQARKLDPLQRRPDWDLFFVQVTVIGASGASLLVDIDGAGAHRLLARVDKELVAFKNLVMLARAPGLTFQAVLAASPEDEDFELLALATPGLQLPPEWGGRVNVGLDELKTAHFEHLERHAPTYEMARPPHVLDGIRQLREETAYAGRHIFRQGQQRGIAREATRLQMYGFRHGSQYLQALLTSAHGTKNILGDPVFTADIPFATAWLRLSHYEEVAR